MQKPTQDVLIPRREPGHEIAGIHEGRGDGR